MSLTYEQAKAEVEEIVSNNKYVFFTASWCPDCVYLKEIFNKYGILDKFYIWELSRYEKGSDDFKLYTKVWFEEAFGQQNIPLLFVNGVYLGTEHQIRSWEKHGKIEENLKKLELI
ncbi:hypothetical protein FOG51_03855 [Hanseniaspora uvarum]|nr:hypothetical protein FOG48_00888 [Hanseniaspora uvarum]KAF0271354.1 hypothetical protein FOG51_03855 [Hanseniaspora uvarum]KAF0275604.1 hypothetical protein FOG50_03544 [Hanseniaspora uvarum]GMM39427.1 hypothetical protein DAHU10_003280 [Hanseniaspora uvarum]